VRPYVRGGRGFEGHDRQAPAGDAALLAAVARGDREAYAALHRRYAAVLLGLVHRILGSRMEAEDVLQEVFLQVWRRAGEFDERRGTTFRWLATLARSRALDRRGVLDARRRLAALRGGDGVEAAVPDPVDAALLAESVRRLRAALAQLSEAQRTVLLLAYFKGLSQSEIARLLGAPLGTVKSQARLGLTKLRQLLRGRAVAAVLVLLLGLQAALWRRLDTAHTELDAMRRVGAFVTSPGVAVVPLRGAGPARDLHAKLAYDRASGRFVLLSSGLATPPAGERYRLWLLGAGVQSVGVVGPGSGGDVLRALPPASGVFMFAVTSEPATVVDAPTGPIILVSDPLRDAPGS
jgi:RNA polymerase sigma-70 factor (ECF subfamily)